MSPTLPASGVEPLVEIAHPAIEIALAYATANNLAGRVLYAEEKALLRPEAVAALYRAADIFAQRGLRIVVLDAYRPVSVQKAFWDIRPDPRYVADPAVGSDHSRGIAVDLTLADAGGPLDMGTEFDAAEVQSHHGRSDISEAAIRNRQILLAVMQDAGFSPLPTEWWHYALPGREAYPLFDDSINALKVVTSGG